MNVRSSRVWVRSAVVTGVCVVLVLPLAAWAQTFHRQDPAHDVVLMTLNEHFRRAPTNKTADITATTFSHSEKRITAKIRLRHYAGAQWYWSQVIRTATNMYMLEGTTAPGRRAKWFVAVEEDHPLTCPGLTATIRPARNTIRASVPNKCLNNPTWVRVHLLYMKWNAKAGMYIDDALRKGYNMTDEGPTWRWTPRLYAG